MVARKKTAAKHKLRTNNCIACGSIITVSASLCPNCYSFQSPWKNDLKYGASVVAVFVVIASVLGWLISLAPDIRRAIIWKDDLKVLSLYSDQEITLGNYGDGTIFVSRLVYGYKENLSWISHTRIINKSIKPGEMISHLLFKKDRYKNNSVIFIFDYENRLDEKSW